MQDLQCQHHLGFLRQVPGIETRVPGPKQKGTINRVKGEGEDEGEECVVLDAPVTKDVHAHHRNPQVYEEKHGVKPGAFAAVQHRCHGHQQICHKMNCEEATH